MTTQTEKDFNNCAESKVVKVAELMQKFEAVRDGELSLAEKIYLRCVEPITGLLATVAYAYASDRGKTTAELWRSEDNTAYISAATFYAQRDFNINFAFNKRISQKNWDLGAKAFAECEDQQGSPAFQRARAVF